jgi:hypothetical protein
VGVHTHLPEDYGMTFTAPGQVPINRVLPGHEVSPVVAVQFYQIRRRLSGHRFVRREQPRQIVLFGGRAPSSPGQAQPLSLSLRGAGAAGESSNLIELNTVAREIASLRSQ